MSGNMYQYLSKNKINMLYEQNHPNSTKETKKEIGGSISAISGSVSTTVSTNLNIYDKLHIVEKDLVQDCSVGDFFASNKQFIRDDIRLEWARNEGVSLWRTGYYDTNSRVFYRFLMYGSSSNLCQINDDQFSCFSGSCFEEVIIALDRALEKSLDKHDEISDYVKENAADLRIRNADFRGINGLHSIEHPVDAWYAGNNSVMKERWQIIENFYITYGGRFFIGQNVIRRVLAHVDFRETITMDNYLNSMTDSRYGEYIKYGRYARSINRVPQDAKYIVYIYASPIAVEFLHIDTKIHVINNKEYLYVAEKEMKSIKKKYPNQPEQVEYLNALMLECGLSMQSYQFKTDYYNLYHENHWNPLSEEQFFQLLSGYITDLAPL